MLSKVGHISKVNTGVFFFIFVFFLSQDNRVYKLSREKILVVLDSFLLWFAAAYDFSFFFSFSG